MPMFKIFTFKIVANFGVHDLKYFELKAKIFDLINGEDNEVEYAI